jgi:aminopeptidase YwaD
MNKSLLLIALLAFSGTQAQKLKKEDKSLMANLQQHLRYLSDDQLEGRRMGTAGEAKAAQYIQAAFNSIGLQPRGTNGFLQTFDVNEGKQIMPTTALTIDDHKLQLGKDFFPLVYSANYSIEALPALALQERNMPWFVDLKELLSESASNPHFDISNAVYTLAKELRRKGASAAVFYNTGTIDDGLRFESKARLEPLAIPVLYVNRESALKHFSDHSATLDIKLNTEISEKKRSGTNVIGFIDNHAANTVVLGAHFDHLGFGEDGNSREVERKNQVHNGADDNASGTAALIEIARLLKHSKATKSNYVFVAFSGEELGLYGSKYFTEHSPVDLSSVNFMINMDMVGRLNDSSKVITVGGFGTSPSWGDLYAFSGKKKMYKGDLQFRFDSSGTGPSDHTSFYLKNIPVLFYFTGLHSDYHKPTDDHDKINYTGQLQIVKHIVSLLETIDKQNQKLVFQKTREAQTTTSARFSVSMGIMPDYTFSGAGVRVDGVSDNKPAQKAGLKAGDVVTLLGEHRITSLESYMQALSKFKKGDKTTVSFVRGAETLSTTVEF